MFRAFGFLIILWGLSKFFTNSFGAFDIALTEVFKTVEVAAVQSQLQIHEFSDEQ